MQTLALCRTTENTLCLVHQRSWFLEYSADTWTTSAHRKLCSHGDEPHSVGPTLARHPWQANVWPSYSNYWKEFTALERKNTELTFRSFCKSAKLQKYVSIGLLYSKFRFHKIWSNGGSFCNTNTLIKTYCLLTIKKNPVNKILRQSHIRRLC